jgi:flavin-dependent thymidylate synthase
METLCEYCDLFVEPGDKCWGCGRQEEEVKTNPRNLKSSQAISTWIDPAMYSAEEMPDDMPRVTLLSATPDPLGALGAMCAMYEGRVVRDLAELSDDDRRRYWDEVGKTHLKAPLEAIDLHFMVEGVTRAFTHQMVRQRTAVYAQESMRFAVKDKIAARPGPIIGADYQHKAFWDDAVSVVWEAYQSLIANGVPAEEARGLLPHDTLTRLNFKTNLRNLADHMGNRLCTQAQFEWRLVAAQIKKAIREYGGRSTVSRPDMDGYSKWQFELIADSDIFQPVCFTVGHCPFKASFDRGCKIRQRVDAGRFHLIRPEEWLADPTAGWVRG